MVNGCLYVSRKSAFLSQSRFSLREWRSWAHRDALREAVLTPEALPICRAPAAAAACIDKAIVIPNTRPGGADFELE